MKEAAMNRRELLKSCGAFAACVATGALTTTGTTKRYGPMTVERHCALVHKGVHIHVFYQGRDVTSRCRFADDTGYGVAELFKKNATGKTYFDRSTGDAAKEIVYGVTMAEGAPL